ncbi:tetratricopeptide repeat protein [bacterium]|nr:tetratricopeptide repeat protein [bacterium]
MAIEVHCDCGNIYSVGPELSGKKIKCKSCKVVLKVPIVPLEASGEPAPPSEEYEVVKDSKAMKDPGSKGAKESPGKDGKKDGEPAAPVVCTTCGAPGKPGDAVCLACGAELGGGGPGLIEKIPKQVIFGVIGVVALLLVSFVSWKIVKSVKLSGQLTAGHTNFDSGKYPAAKSAFEQALVGDPDNVEALEGLVQIGMTQPDWGLVKKRAPALVAKTPAGNGRAVVKRNLARAFLESGDFPNTIKWAKDARAEDSSVEAVDEIQGLAHLGANEKDAAVELLTKADSSGSRNPKVQLGLAKLNESNIKDARRWAVKAAGFAAKDATVLLALARVCEMDGDKPAATSALEQAREADPKSAAVRVKLATAYLEQKRPKDALVEAKEAKASKPDDPEVSKVLGQALLENGESAAAKEELARAEKLAGDDPSPGFLLGRALIKTGEIPQGIDRLEKAMKKRDKDVSLWLEAGRIVLNEAKKPEKAVVFLESALRLEPRLGESDPPEVKKPFAEGRILLARALAAPDGGREKSAAKIQSVLTEAMALDPTREEIYIDLGNHYLLLGKPAEALAALDQGVQVAPRNTTLLREVHTAAMRAKDFDKAIDAAKKLIEINPKDEDAKNRLESAQLGKAESGKP